MKRTKTTLNPAEFPAEIRPCLAGAEIWDSSCSPEARVWYIDREGGLFLKKQAAGMLKEEAVMTAYFHALGLSAEVLCYAQAEGHDYLLTRRVPGEDCTHAMYRAEPERLCNIMGTRLRALHETDAADCPVKDRLEAYRAGVRGSLESFRYEPDRFPAIWPFASAEEVKAAAEEGLPLLKADALIHGDYCLPNIMLDNWRFTGFIDVGAGGVSDRHIDLYWGVWSLAFNLKTTRRTDRFLDAYGRDSIDPDLLRCVAAMEMTAE